MSRCNVPSFPRAWPRLAVLALIGVTAAACSDSARFVQYDPLAKNTARSNADVTGSVNTRPVTSSRVAARPLPAPGRPQTVAAASHAGVANGAPGLGAYRPGRSGDVTGSVPTAGHWSRHGGTTVTVARGQTINSIARQYNVPASAIIEANHLTNPNAIEPGQRLIVPRNVAGEMRPAAEPRTATAGNVHVVKPGETLISIARRNGMSLSALARANRISPYTRLNIGDRVTVPAGTHQLAARTVPAPKAAQPAPVETVASVPTQTANVAKPEIHQDKPVVSKAEPAGGIPSFRWPVRGRIISGFGARANGTQNDGINLAVPEGTPIKAADDGVVAYAGNELKGYGNLVLVRHPNGYVSAYANASKLMVKRGDNVKRGQVIARAGQTGNVNSPQLHFEIRKGSMPVDPTKYLSGA
jgi:murein DD-endopeptidase MepM/ murein hydrolase activator NlpD